MSIPVLLAVTEPDWESTLVAALTGGTLPIEVSRRCVDVADLLAAAAAGLGRAAVVSAALRQLDREAVTRLAACGVAVVGAADPSDEAAERWLRQCGVRQVVTTEATPDEVSVAVMTALADPADTPGRDWGEPRGNSDASGSRGAAEPYGPVDGSAGLEPASCDQPRPILAVWGPAGAPGRTTVAVNLAAELVRLTGSALLVDADVYAASVAQVLGLLDESPGIAAACRLANAGRLDVASLAEVSLAIRGGLRVLTGLPRADRWPELRPSALEEVLRIGRHLAAVTVVDLSFCLEQDEELSFDTAAPRRNGATLACLDAADLVIAVGSGEPVGLQRFARAIEELREAVPGAAIRPVVNRVRRGPIPGGDVRAEIGRALERYAGVSGAAFLPEDRAACDAAIATGRTLAEAAPNSPLRAAIAGLAAGLGATYAGVGTAPAARRVLRGRVRRRGVRYAGR